jgi:hypothetical protein
MGGPDGSTSGAEGGATDADAGSPEPDATPDSTLGADAPGDDGGNDTGGGDATADSTTDAPAPTSDGGVVVFNPPYPCGATPGGPPGDAGPTTLLPFAGARGDFGLLFRSGDRVVQQVPQSGQYQSGWALWDVAAERQIKLAQSTSLLYGMFAAGGTFVVEYVDAEIHSMADGSLLGTIPATAVSGLAFDGTYLWKASKTGLQTWSLTGTPLANRAGDYSTASIFAAPGKLEIGNGPLAGGKVIEYVDATTGASTVTPPLVGAFGLWFADGSHFTSTLSTTTFVYTPDAKQVAQYDGSAGAVIGGWGQRLLAHTSVNLQGNGFVHVIDLDAPDGAASAQFYTDNAMQVGRLVPLILSNTEVVDGGWTGICNGGAPGCPRRFELLDLVTMSLTSPPMLVYDVGDSSFYMPLKPFAADPNGLWVATGFLGSLQYYGTTASPTHAGQLGCGQILSVRGSASGKAAVGTASGQTLVIDVPSAHVDEVLHSAPNTYVALSADGKTLGTLTNWAERGFLEPSVPPLNIVDVPTGTVRYSLTGDLDDFSLSVDGTTLGRAETGGARIVSDVSGQNVLITDTSAQNSYWYGYFAPKMAPLISPSNVYVAINDWGSGMSLLYKQGKLYNSVQGAAVGWVNDNMLLAMVGGPPAVMQIYDNQANLLGKPPLPPIDSFDVVQGTHILSRNDGKIYDVSTGAVIQSPSATPEIGGATVAGSFILSVVNQALIATPH